MTVRHLRLTGIVTAVGAALALLPTLASAQQDRRDLQGVWDFRSVVPFERPEEFSNKETLTEEEAAEYAQQRVDALNVDLRRDENGRVPLSGGYNNFWYDRGTSLGAERRTSLVVDPPNGRIPARTESAQARLAERRMKLGRDAWEPADRGAFERCILGFNSGPPMNPSAYNNNMQLFQTDDHVVILNEMVHDSRIIPLDGTPELNAGIRQWMGSSRGRWDGDTLVVETRNFTDKTTFRGSGPNLHLVERFTRMDADTLLYEYTVNDPESFEQPWSVRTLMKRSDAPVYEYACHEGNYGMENLMTVARTGTQGQ